MNMMRAPRSNPQGAPSKCLPLLPNENHQQGQITIPFSIHNRFGLRPGVEMETDTGMIGT
jgi:hypothetical protein